MYRFGVPVADDVTNPFVRSVSRTLKAPVPLDATALPAASTAPIRPDMLGAALS